MTERKLAFYLSETQKLHKKGQRGDLGMKEMSLSEYLLKRVSQIIGGIPSHWQRPQTAEDSLSTQATEFYEEGRVTCWRLQRLSRGTHRSVTG